uniref:Condensin complex subunit 1 n=1 Tax=Angiostrongylus cantonensis TaxID=6313 RepID=A0A0K0DB80_ANGCA
MRPSGDILDEFYALADLDSKKRTDAVSRLLMKVENGRANAIGRHLLVSAICRSKMYSEANVVLLEHELEIYRACPSLGMSVAQQMAELISEIDKKTFKSQVLPLIRDYLDSALTRSSVEFVYLALLVKDHVIEKWCTSGDESKVLERIFDTAKLTLSNSSEAHKEILVVFSPFLLKRIVQVAHGKRNAQNRILRDKIADFCKFVEDFLSLTEDSDLLEVIETLDTTENFDSLTGSNLIGHLIGRLSREGVAKWIQTAGKPWSFGHICTAFPHWSNDAKVEALSALLHRAKSEQLQYAVGNCISCLFKMKVRAGAFVSASLVEGGEDVLRQVVTTAFGKHVVKSAMKKLDGSVCYKGTLMVFWMCLNLWSKVASSNQMSRGYYNNAEELLMVVEGGEESLTVLLDQLMALLSQPLKYHRTVVYYVFVHLLEYIKDEHIAHIIQTLMMNDDELVEEQESDANSSSNGDNGKFIHIQNLSICVDEHADDKGSESDSFGNDEAMDCETIDRLETSLGSAAVKRKGGTVDEEELADLLLFALSSLSTPASVKVHMIIPLLKLAKLQLKQSSECDNYRKTMSLLKIISHLKKIHLADEEVVSLLDQLVQECIGISNPILASVAATLSSFIFSLGMSSDGVHPETVLSAFIGLFERFMTQEDGLIGSDLAVAAVVKHPEAFVSKSKVFLKAAFNENYRIFRRTAALMCLSTIMSRKVLQKVPVEKSVVKGIAKLSSQYFVASLAQPETIKPRFFASVLKLLVSVASGVPGEYKVRFFFLKD